MPTEINITFTSILRVTLILLGIAFIYIMKDILVILFLALVLSSALEPWVVWFENHNLPRGFGLVSFYTLVFVVIALIGISLVPEIVYQTKILARDLPELVDKWNAELFSSYKYGGHNGETLSRALNSLSNNIIPAVRGLFGGGLALFLLVALTFYLSVEDKNLKRFFRSILPARHQDHFTRVVKKIQKKMGMWCRGQMLLSLIIFLLTAVSLFTIHKLTGLVPFWLVLAVIAGILEVVPFVGPLIAGGIAVILVMSSSLWLAAAVIFLYVLIQQIENHILLPKIMQKTVGLNPIIVILVIFVGSRLAGAIGAIISIPFAAAVHVLLKELKNGERVSS